MKKKKIFILPILFCYLTVQAQTSSKNYLLEKQMLDAAGNQAITTVTYYDSLRYPVETASYELGGNGKFAYEYRYNERGRCIWKRLPSCEYQQLWYNNAIKPLHIGKIIRRNNHFEYVYD